MTVEVEFEGFERRPLSDEPSDSAAASLSRLAEVEKIGALAFEAFRLARFGLESSRSSFDADPQFEIFPTLTLNLGIPGVEEPFDYELVLDDTLFAQLVGIYSSFGWTAIQEVRDRSVYRFSPVAGVSSQPDLVEQDSIGAAMTYMDTCLQLLHSLIYDALVYLEQTLKGRAIASLTHVSGLANQAFHRLRLERRGTLERPHYAFSKEDHALAKNIHFALTEFAKNYRALLNAIERQAALRKSLKSDRDRLSALRTDIELTMMVIASDAPLPDTDIDELEKRIADAQRDLLKFEAVEKVSTPRVDALYRGVSKHIPAALPLCLMVNPTDGPSVVADKLGQFYRAMSERSDKLQAVIERESRYVHRLSGRPLYRDPKLVTKVYFRMPEEGLENLVARTAIARRESDTDAQVLSDADALWELLDTDLLPVGSVEHMVANQYALALEARLAEVQQAEAASRADDVALSKLSSALSLLTLVPGMQPVGRIATVIDLVMIARFFSKSADLLRSLELEADQKVLSLSEATFGSLGDLAAVIDNRRRSGQQIQEEVLKMLIMQGASQIPNVRGLLAARSYYFDVETLLVDSA